MVEQPESRQKRSIGGPLLMFGLLATALTAVVWANLWKSDLRIADVHVDGNTIVGDKEILALANIAKDQRLYSIDLLAAQQRIMQNAFIKSVAVNREAPNSISIMVEERVPIVAVVLDKMEYLSDDGVVLPPVRTEGIFDLPVLTGTFQTGEFTAGKKVTRGDVKEALEILATAQQLGDEIYGRISEIRIESGRDIIFYTAESGIPVVFGRGDPAMKLVKFEGFWKDIVLHRGARELAYVDLRFEDQVVVRWNHVDEEAQAIKTVVEKSRKGKG
jgi:cell division septal protein FtsQ